MSEAATPPPGTAAEVFRAFLKLGLTAFGGPIAHVGYMREEFVVRRGWLDEARFAQLLAVCQFLPGPASSQMGLAIGLFRGGWRGAIAAFVAFTLPSALLMFAFASLAPHLAAGPGEAVVHGLKLVAVAVVAHGLLAMVRTLTPDAPRIAIAFAAATAVVLAGQAWMQLLVIAAGAVLGLVLCRHVASPLAGAGVGQIFPLRHGRRGALACLVVFFALLALALGWPAGGAATPAAAAAAFYRTGALVFGGGHVVLPLLQQAVVDTGWMRADDFLAGYGAAQAVPGPMFSLAAYLGAKLALGLPSGVGAALALGALFLPGFLVLLAVLPLWSRLARYGWASRAMAGINAAVVGLLAAAFYDPVLLAGVRGGFDLLVALGGFLLLAVARVSALWVVLLCVVASVGRMLLS